MTDCRSGQCATAQKVHAKPDQDEAVTRSLSQIKHKIMVMSGKGGVGKTSVSVNLALNLANQGFKVGLMDVDIHGPDIPAMLGLSRTPQVSQNHKLIPVAHSRNLGAISIESLIAEKDNAIIWRGPMKFAVIKQFLGEVEWGHLDFLIIDAPPGTGDEPLTVAQTVTDALAVVVTTPQAVALADVRKSINFCKTLNLQILGIVENMSDVRCPHCGKPISVFGSGGGENTARDMGLEFLGRIPFDPNMVACADAGVSFLSSHPDTEATKALNQIADKIVNQLV